MRINFEDFEDKEQILSPKASLRKSINKYLQPQQNQETNNIYQSISSQKESLRLSINFPQEKDPSIIVQTNKKLSKSAIKFIQNQYIQEKEKEKEKINDNSQKQKGQILTPLQQSKQQIKNKGLNHLKNTKYRVDIPINQKKQIKNKKYKNIASKLYNIKPKESTKEMQYKEDLSQVTLRPILNYTMNSKAAKNVQIKRKNYFNKKNINVFESLYIDAQKNASKRLLEKIIIQEENKSFQSRQNKKYMVFQTFEERLERSIEKQAQIKIKSQNKILYNQTTGKKFFVPDTMKSKITYFSHFKSVYCSKSMGQQLTYPARPVIYSKDSQKFNYSQQLTTTLNYSCEHELNKSLNFQSSKIQNKSLLMNRAHKLAQIYCQLIWSKDYLKQEFLTHMEIIILKTFLTEIKKYENLYSNNVSKQVFIAYFKDFYQTLNLYDKEIIDQRLKNQKEIQKQERLYHKAEMEEVLKPKKSKATKNKYYYKNLDYIQQQFIV